MKLKTDNIVNIHQKALNLSTEEGPQFGDTVNAMWIECSILILSSQVAGLRKTPAQNPEEPLSCISSTEEHEQDSIR